MTETQTPAGSTEPPTSTHRASSGPEPVILRDWPKIVMMLPTLFASIICGIIMAIHPEFPDPQASQFGWQYYVGLLFLLVLAINLTMLLYDLNLRGFVIVVLAILAMVLALFLLNNYAPGKVWRGIGRALSVRVWANAAFYFMIAIILLFNLAVAWIITRFHYWKVENNEIIIRQGFMHEQERHPTAQARFKLIIEDIVEYGLLGSGKLVFYFSDDSSQHELRTVLFVHSKAKKLDEILGRVAVIERS